METKQHKHWSQFKAVARTTDEPDGEMRCLSYNCWILSNVMKNKYAILSRNYKVFSHDHEIRITS